MRLTTRYGNGEKLITNIFRAVLPVLIYLALCTAVMTLSTTVFSFLFLKKGIDVITEEMIQALSMPVAGISAAVSIPVFIWYNKRADIRRQYNKYAVMANVSPEEAIELRDSAVASASNIPFRENIWVVIAGICLALSLNLMVNFLGSGNSGAQYNETVGTIFNLPLYLQFAISGLLVPTAEELVFRGGMFIQLREWLNFIPSVIICGLAFGLYHMNLVQGIYAFIMGMVFCIIVEKYCSFWSAVISHAFANITIIVLKQLDVLNYLVFKNMVLGIIISILFLLMGIVCVIKILKLDPTIRKK